MAFPTAQYATYIKIRLFFIRSSLSSRGSGGYLIRKRIRTGLYLVTSTAVTVCWFALGITRTKIEGNEIEREISADEGREAICTDRETYKSRRELY